MENSQTEKEAKMRKKKDVCGFFKRVKNIVRCYYRGNEVTPSDPPGPSNPSPSPPSVEMTLSTEMIEPDSVSLSAPSSLELIPDSSQTSSECLPEAGPSGLQPVTLVDPQPGPSDLELTADTSGVDSEQEYVSCESSLELTPDPADPVPGPSDMTMTLPRLTSGFCPTVGTFFSLYDRGEILGSGAFGTVYKGTRKSDGQKVAIKVLTKSVQDSFVFIPGCTKPLLVEVALNLVLREPPTSPYVVQMYEWFEEHYRYILIMEYPHPCETLLDFTMRKGGILDETVARGLFRQAVLAAKHCVGRGILHRDIKPDNILINTRTLKLKLIDFGCGQLFATSDNEGTVHRESQCSVLRITVKSLGSLLFQMVHRINLDDKQMIPSSSLSSECSDLINQCKSNSPTFEEILEHAWFKKH